VEMGMFKSHRSAGYQLLNWIMVDEKVKKRKRWMDEDRMNFVVNKTPVARIVIVNSYTGERLDWLGLRIFSSSKRPRIT